MRVLASLLSAGAALASGAGGGLILPPSTSRGPMAGLQGSRGEVQASVGQCFRQGHPWPRADQPEEEGASLGSAVGIWVHSLALS